MRRPAPLYATKVTGEEIPTLIDPFLVELARPIFGTR
jgi:hypothetical protein